MEVAVSIIIPCYNGERVIDRSIESVYVQECDGIMELIVVDDGSTDQSKEKINNWISQFSQKGHILKYVYQQNKGLGGAIDTGLKYVTGKYLTLLDADDVFLPGSVKKRMAFLENNHDFVGVRSNGYQDKEGERKLFVTEEKEKKNTNLFDGLIGGNSTNWAGSYMICTKELFTFYRNREIYPSKFGQNMQLLLPVAYKRKFGFIDEPLMIYFLQSNSLSQSATVEERYEKDDRNFYGYLDIYKHMINLIVLDESERKYYLNIIASWKYCHELKKAVLLKDKEKMQYYYELYKSTGRMNLNEKIDYYSVVNPVKMIVLKFYRRILTIFKH